MKKRKVKIIDDMTNECMIIITDAPLERMETEMKDRDVYLNSLSKDYYVKLLCDSKEDPQDVINIVDYKESCYVNGNKDEIFKRELIKHFAENAERAKKGPSVLGNYDKFPAFYE